MKKELKKWVFLTGLFLWISACSQVGIDGSKDQPSAKNAANITPQAVVLTTIVSATASTVNGANTALMSCDKNTGTRWESATADPQWIYWDLGSSQALNQIIIDWEAASASNYTIQGSTDAANWTILATVVNTKSMVNHLMITNSLSGTFRYVKMNGTTRSTIYGYSIWEVSIFTTTGASSAASTVVSSSSSQVSSAASSVISSTVSSAAYPTLAAINAAVASTVNGANTAAMSYDKNTTTRWESANTDPQWIYWDLGSAKQLSSIIIDWEGASASNYTIQGSLDTVNWSTLATGVNSKGMVNHLMLTNALSGTYRYVKMNGTTRTTIYGYSIYEVSIYASGGNTSSGGSLPANSSSSSSVVSSTASSASGVLVVSGMTGNNLTVTYNSGAQYTSCRLYISQGNGLGLILASQEMTYSGGKYTYTVNNSSYTSGAVIKLMILRNTGNGDTPIVQGVISDVSTWASFTYASSSSINIPTIIGASSSGNVSSSGSAGSVPALPAVNAGMQMTFQVTNLTGGKWANNQIYITAQVRRQSDNQFCNLAPDGTLTLCTAGDNTSAHSYKVSDYPTWQFPTFMSSGRLYVSYGAPLNCPYILGADNLIGIAYPNTENTSDPNVNTYFDWIEFYVGNNAIWVNTTQVDILGAPLKLSLYSGSGSSYSLYNEVGITNTWESIRTSWSNQMDSTWDSLCDAHRISAPIHGGSAFSTFFDAYVNSMWSKYTTSDFVINMPQGVCTGRVQADGRLKFNKPNDITNYYVSKPSSRDIWGGLGTLASPSVENANNPGGLALELALEAQICAAFHRGIVADPSTWNTPTQFYASGTYDIWSKFMHSISLNGGRTGNRAYGFCYDDVNDYSSTMNTGSPRGLVMSLYWQ